MDLIVCECCGSVVRRDQVRGFCAVCGRRTCIACMRVCDSCSRIVCHRCVRLCEVWRSNRLYLLKLCDECRSRLDVVVA